MAKIDIGQIDDFSPDFNQVVTDGQIPVWNAEDEEFQPEDQAAEQIIFRRAFLLMGA
jgi:hypothetical protein